MNWEEINARNQRRFAADETGDSPVFAESGQRLHDFSCDSARILEDFFISRALSVVESEGGRNIEKCARRGNLAEVRWSAAFQGDLL